MHPQIWIGGDVGLVLPTHALLVALGFVIAGILAVRGAPQGRLDAGLVFDLALFCFVFGVLGGRVGHVLFDGHMSDYLALCVSPEAVELRGDEALCPSLGGRWDGSACRPTEADCMRWAKFWLPGMTLYGGILASGAFGLWFLRREGCARRAALDLAAAVVPVGVAVGRLGCHFAGCCFGSPATDWPALRFPPGSPASVTQWREGSLPSPHLPSLPVHPTQLYESALCLALAFGATWLLPRKRFDGQLLLVVLSGYGLGRLLLETLRGDGRGGLVGLSPSQWISLAILVTCGVLYQRWRPR